MINRITTRFLYPFIRGSTSTYHVCLNTRKLNNSLASSRHFTSPVSNTSYKHIIVNKQGQNGCVQVIQLNRPDTLNALCDALMRELSTALKKADTDDSISAIVLTGNEKAFAAGADIKEMQNKTLQVL